MTAERADTEPRQVMPVVKLGSIMKGMIPPTLAASRPALRRCLPGRRRGADFRIPRAKEPLECMTCPKKSPQTL